MKVRITVGHCQVFVQGMEMDCPLCHTHVESGQHHECIIQRDKVLKKKPTMANRKKKGPRR